jgi:soluble lytic murein transglycosylase-like protein
MLMRSYARRVPFAALAALLALTLRAEECGDAMLTNGFVMRNVRLQQSAGVTRLALCGDGSAGFLEFPSNQIAHFEARPKETAPALPAPPVESARTVPARPPAESVRTLITDTALRFMIDPDFVASVVKAESGTNPAAVSPKGARGLMQLMPRTAATLGVTDALDAAQNLEGGTRYLRQLLDQYNGNVAAALSAYNAGPGAVKRYGGVPPYAETRAYIARIVSDYGRKKTERLNELAAAEATK